MIPAIMPAYIDPAAGAMILQWVAAAAVGVLIFYRRTIGRILRLLTRRRRDGGTSGRPSECTADPAASEHETPGDGKNGGLSRQ
jgi:hypothetical protein